MIQLPEFEMTNVMGSDAYIYPDTAAVLDLDVVIPPGVDIIPLQVSHVITCECETHKTGQLRAYICSIFFCCLFIFFIRNVVKS